MRVLPVGPHVPSVTGNTFDSFGVSPVESNGISSPRACITIDIAWGRLLSVTRRRLLSVTNVSVRAAMKLDPGNPQYHRERIRIGVGFMEINIGNYDVKLPKVGPCL